MANGINPSVRPAGPKPKKSNAPAILGTLSVLFLGTTGYFYSQVATNQAVIGELQEGLIGISKAAESEAYTAEKLAIATNQAQLITSLTEAVGNKVVDVQIARAEATREKEAATKNASERDAALTQLSDARRQLDAARQDTTSTKAKLDALQKKYDSEIAVLNAKIEALEGGAVVEADQAGAPATQPAEATSPAAEQASDAPAGEQTEAAPAVTLPVGESSMVVPEGGSQLFKTIRYDGSDSSLTFVTITDEKLVYTGVPAELYVRLANAPVLDLFYRFQVMEKFPSTPKDVDLIQAITADSAD